MTVELITGHAGAAHVSSTDAGWYNAGTVGAGKYVLDTGTRFAANVQSANVVQIGVGDAVFEGRHVRVSATENVSIDNGAQGVNRNDIICIKYEYDSSTDIETASLAVIKGAAVSGTPSDPTIPSGSILNGASTAYMPLWRIPINGITVGTPVKLYGNVLVTLGGVVSRTWAASQIPNLPASKITSGTFDAARIPSLDASKIGSGTLADARIPNINTSKLTAGTLPVSRGGTGKNSGTCYMVDMLYNNTSGTNGNITLSASAANYAMIEVFFRTNGNRYDSVKVYSPNGKIASLATTQSLGTALMSGFTVYNQSRTFSGTSFNVNSYYTVDVDGNGVSQHAYNYIYVTQVIGYK